MRRIDDNPRKLYGDHHLAVRDAMELSRSEANLGDTGDNFTYVVTHGEKPGDASYIEIFDTSGNPVGYW